jgi:hypothetical protein
MSSSHDVARLLGMSRLTHVVDIGANPIDGAPPYRPLLDAQLCRVTGFEPQPSALAELNLRKGANETYFPYAVGDGEAHTLNLCAYSGWTSTFVPSAAALSRHRAQWLSVLRRGTIGPLVSALAQWRITLR